MFAHFDRNCSRHNRPVRMNIHVPLEVHIFGSSVLLKTPVCAYYNFADIHYMNARNFRKMSRHCNIGSFGY